VYVSSLYFYPSLICASKGWAYSVWVL